MSNDYSIVKKNLSSEKIIYIRLNPARSIMGDLVLDTGSIYKMTLPLDAPSKIEINGVAGTKVTTISSNGHWTFDESTKLLRIQLANAPSWYQSNDGNIVLFYYLFYTNTIDRYAHEDPEDVNSAVRFYKGRLANEPQLEITQENIIDGVFTIGNTSVELFNQDRDFNKYLTINDSFSRKEVKIWRALNSSENIRKMFFGISGDISLGDSVSISVDSSLSITSDTYYLGLEREDVIFTKTNYPSLRDGDVDKPIHKMYCRSCKTTTIQGSWGLPSFGKYFFQGSSWYSSIVGIEEGYELVNASYNPEPSTTVNRSWRACFATSAPLSTAEISSVYSFVSSPSAYYDLFEFTVSDGHDYVLGDYVRVVSSDLTQVFYVQVIEGYSNKTILAFTAGSFVAPFPPYVTITWYIIPLLSFTVQGTFDTHIYNLIPGPHYNTDVDSLGVLRITLANNFEADFGGPPGSPLAELSPDTKIFYRVKDTKNMNHSLILKEVLESAGISCDTTSFNSAAATEMKTKFSIPYFGDTGFPSLRTIVQDFLNSAFGVLSVNNDFSVEYDLLESAPSATDEVDQNSIIDNSLKQEIKFSDISTELFFENIHHDRELDNHGVSIPFVSPTFFKENAAGYLHGVKNPKEISHLLDEITYVIPVVLIKNVLKNRRNTITFSTKGANFESIIGDDIKVRSDKLVGAPDVLDIDYKIFSVSNNKKETVIRAIDLLGL
jgi:hypothetical protein